MRPNLENSVRTLVKIGGGKEFLLVLSRAP